MRKKLKEWNEQVNPQLNIILFTSIHFLGITFSSHSHSLFEFRTFWSWTHKNKVLYGILLCENMRFAYNKKC